MTIPFGERLSRLTREREPCLHVVEIQQPASVLFR